MEFAAGGRVAVRGLAWDVVEVVPLGAQTLLRLRCAAGDLTGLEWDVLHPAETVALLRATMRPDHPGSLASWRLHHQACLLDQVLGAEDAFADEPGRVRIEPYQLVPLMRALELPRPRLLLADGVGLGKTIEAGLIICALITRRRAHRVLIVSPAGPLLMQWRQEMRQRFGLRFTAITDAASLHAERRRLELGGNPFDAVALCVTSMDFAKQERVLQELERSAWDLAIIDEAHHCIGVAGIDAEATQRRRLAEMVARQSDGLLLLTATPHDGHDAHFASLIELLDPSLVDGHGAVIGTAYRRHVVRRLKSHIRDPTTGAPLFRERRVLPVRIAIASPSVRRFHEALAALVAPRLRRGAPERADALAFVSLLKRSVSTVAACVATLRVVAERYARPETEALRRERVRTLRAYRRRVLRFGVLDEAAESDVAELEADGMAADLQCEAPHALAALTRTDATPGALDALIGLGEAAQDADPKLHALLREIAAIRAEVPGANVIIYTEYADSQAAAVRALRAAVDGEVLAINGLDGEPERSRVADRFAECDGIVLVSTDSLAEGLNLQRRCWHLVHLDLPYNPNRLEQRNGRIDRYGQTHAPQVRYLYLAGTFEERLLLRLIAKYEKAREHLTFMPDTLAVTADQEAWSAGLVAGFAERQATLFDDEPSAIRGLDRVAEDSQAEAYRDLLREIDRAFDGFDRSAVRHGWLAPTGDAPVAVRPAGEGIDLADFVAVALAAETGEATVDRDVLPLPADWLAGLDDLPGVDRDRGVLRLTRDRERLRDAAGHALAFLGRAHPVVRRAIARVLAAHPAGSDVRVAVARTNPSSRGRRAATPDTGPAAVLTFIGECGTAQRIVRRRLIAVHVPRDGPPAELPAGAWLDLAVSEPAAARDTAWRDLFAAWLPQRQADAEALAAALMAGEADRVGTNGRAAGERQEADLLVWLQRRADDICGRYEPRTGDLFGAVATLPDWRWLPVPLERLAAFSADGGNPVADRRAAAAAVELFQARAAETAAMSALLPPGVRLVGMLLLVGE
ncbi:MAG: helicase-related protein [Acetobacteraceae bacterium]